ncbi:hypothetical protein CYMTET_30598 [Cymbomonas tetramitiformis]|uniref:Rhodanese domain-containing protein n=1 Tax=Cymbomonas tetramitiformis TaxID=36881 RepID=A0AAE0FIZ4_9CHLO|nr:hypothetical protein CYMTET_30598 [Cymbomonas tetramitiformis]
MYGDTACGEEAAYCLYRGTTCNVVETMNINYEANLGKSILKNFSGPLGALGIGSGKTVGKNKKVSWEADQYPYLLENTESVSAVEAKKRMDTDGYVLIDVRPSEDFEEYHPEGALNTPLYQYISGNSPRQLLRSTAFAAQGVKPIEYNEGFLDEAKEAMKEAKGVVFACGPGGSLQSTPNFPSGQPSRSLQAAYRVLQEGTKIPVLHLRAGLNTWFKEGFSGEGSAEDWDDQSGRTPSAAGYTPTQDSDDFK